MYFIPIDDKYRNIVYNGYLPQAISQIQWYFSYNDSIQLNNLRSNY